MFHSGILGKETFNMFYINPYFISSLPLFDSMQRNAPFFVFFVIYLLAIFLGASIVFLLKASKETDTYPLAVKTLLNESGLIASI